MIQGGSDEDDDGNKDEDEEDKPQVKFDDQEIQKNKRLEKKRRMKERFNSAYDDGDGDATYFDDLKDEMKKQAEVRGHMRSGRIILQPRALKPVQPSQFHWMYEWTCMLYLVYSLAQFTNSIRFLVLSSNAHFESAVV